MLSATTGKVFITSLLLSGIVVSYFISAIISVTMMLNHDKIENIIFWNMGSIAGAENKKLLIMTSVIAGLLFIYLLKKHRRN